MELWQISPYFTLSPIPPYTPIALYPYRPIPIPLISPITLYPSSPKPYTPWHSPMVPMIPHSLTQCKIRIRCYDNVSVILPILLHLYLCTSFGKSESLIYVETMTIIIGWHFCNYPQVVWIVEGTSINMSHSCITNESFNICVFSGVDGWATHCHTISQMFFSVHISY